jgi:hypothetical protein
MTKITIGSTIVGASGKKLIVDRVDGDIIYSGEFKISTLAVAIVIPPPLIERLRAISILGKPEAIECLSELLSEMDMTSIYEASLDIDTYAGVFIRRLLVGIHPIEFAAIGKDGSEGKYGVLTFPDLPEIS